MTIMQARPTMYRGVLMRSRLEASFAEWLDLAGLQWDYEPVCYTSKDGQYLPDFRLRAVHVGTTGERTVYFEVKPPLERPAALAVLDRMKAIWASEPQAILALAMADHADWFWLTWCTAAGPTGEAGWSSSGLAGDAMWMSCEGCRLAWIESERRLHAGQFFPEPPAACPRCGGQQLALRSHWERRPTGGNG
jgi:hypothetical protein